MQHVFVDRILHNLLLSDDPVISECYWRFKRFKLFHHNLLNMKYWNVINSVDVSFVKSGCDVCIVLFSQMHSFLSACLSLSLYIVFCYLLLF